MTIRGEDVFRTRSYRNAAESVRGWGVSLEEIVRRDGTKGLQEIPGVGKAISGKILELLERGTFDAWERLISETPESTLDLLKIDGVNLKIAQQLYTRFRVASREDLREFIEGDGLDLLDGVGEKTIERIKRALA